GTSHAGYVAQADTARETGWSARARPPCSALAAVPAGTSMSDSQGECAMAMDATRFAQLPRGEALIQAVCGHVAADASFGGYVQRKYRALADPARGASYRIRFAYELMVAGVDLHGATVVDAGCGSGIYTMLMLARGAARVLAYDVFDHN